MQFIIYGLADPRTGDVHYIGKSSSGLKRPEKHRIPSKLALDFTPKARWIRRLQTAGVDFEVCVLEVIERGEDLAAAEIRWIALGRSEGWPLTNLTDGGDGRSPGYKVPEEEVERVRREWAAGIRKHSPETIEKLRASKTGVPRSEETKARIRASMLRPEAVARWREQVVGRPKTEEHRKALSEAHKGRTPSPETRAKMAASRRAWLAANPVSAETREKIAAAKRGKARPDLLGKARPDIAEANRRRTGIPRPDVAERNRQRARKPPIES